eukprot:361988-Chlamydomonas_euryale.AAC.11
MTARMHGVSWSAVGVDRQAKASGRVGYGALAGGVCSRLKAVGNRRLAIGSSGWRSQAASGCRRMAEHTMAARGAQHPGTKSARPSALEAKDAHQPHSGGTRSARAGKKRGPGMASRRPVTTHGKVTERC